MWPHVHSLPSRACRALIANNRSVVSRCHPRYNTLHPPKREPGPIALQRYVGTPAYSGIPTFMGIPICLTQDDLRAGKVDVAILGAPVDMSTGQRGAAFGPRYGFFFARRKGQKAGSWAENAAAPPLVAAAVTRWLSGLPVARSVAVYVRFSVSAARSTAGTEDIGSLAAPDSAR
jgi:hypothetical protein